MDQGTRAWHEWRKKGIGSSDAPVIMEVSPYKTLYQLWKEKLGPIKEEAKSFIFEKGHRLEAQARAEIEIELGYNLSPIICEHYQASWLQASMDGINIFQQYAIECKVVGQDVFDAGVCPIHYFPQIQHQYLVTGMKQIDLVMIVEIRNEKKKIIGFKKKFVEVPCDHYYIMTELLPKLMDFRFHNLINKKPPQMTNKELPRLQSHYVSQMIKELKNLYKKEVKLDYDLATTINDINEIERKIALEMTNNRMKIGKDIFEIQEGQAILC